MGRRLGGGAGSTQLGPLRGSLVLDREEGPFEPAFSLDGFSQTWFGKKERKKENTLVEQQAIFIPFFSPQSAVRLDSKSLASKTPALPVAVRNVVVGGLVDAQKLLEPSTVLGQRHGMVPCMFSFIL